MLPFISMLTNHFKPILKNAKLYNCGFFSYGVYFSSSFKPVLGRKHTLWELSIIIKLSVCVYSFHSVLSVLETKADTQSNLRHYVAVTGL